MLSFFHRIQILYLFLLITIMLSAPFNTLYQVYQSSPHNSTDFLGKTKPEMKQEHLKIPSGPRKSNS